MTVTSVSKLKASLSEFLRRVKAGEEVLVTERGRVIARLSPPASSPSLPESLREMERQGLVKLGTGKLPKDFWRMPRPKDPKGLVMKALLEERSESRGSFGTVPPSSPCAWTNRPAPQSALFCEATRPASHGEPPGL